LLRILIVCFIGLLSLEVSAIHDLEIEEETYDFFIAGNKGYATHFRIKRNVTFKVNTAKGVDELSEFVLPDQIDPLYRNIAPEVRNMHFRINNLKVEHLACKIRLPRGGWETVEMTPVKKMTRFVNPVYEMYRESGAYHYPIKGVEIGSIVNIEYDVMIRMDVNRAEMNCNRIFFHGKYPKKKLKVKLSYMDDLYVLLDYPNEGYPHSSIKGDKIVDTWEFEDLPASLADVNGRPHIELPHVQYQLFDHIGFLYSASAFFPLEAPIQYNHGLTREWEFVQNRLSIEVGSTSKQYASLNNMIREHSPKTEDNDGVLALTSIHNDIVENGVYENDHDFFTNDDWFDPDWGEDLLSNRFREVSRYRTYSCLTYATMAESFSGFLCDKRVGRISTSFLKPILQSDYVFVVVGDNGAMRFVYPKYQNTGFYMDELPFYFESSETMLIDYYFNYELSDGMPEDIKLVKTLKTPASNLADNSRGVNSQLSIDVASGVLTSQTKAQLKGQYSTMTRGLYLHNEEARFVDSSYNVPIWKYNNQTTVDQVNAGVKSTSFPFTTGVDCAATTQLELQGDSAWRLDLGKLIHPIYSKLNAYEGRTLAYYPDFMGADQWSALLALPESKVELPEPINLSNPYGSVQLVFSQTGQGVLVRFSYQVKQDVVPVTNFDQVVQVDQALKQLQQSYILIPKG